MDVRKSVAKHNHITVEETIEFIQLNASVAAPIFIIQTNLRQKVIGSQFWVDLANYRSSGTLSGEN